MFKFLKEKLKNTISGISEKIEKEAEDSVEEVVVSEESKEAPAEELEAREKEEPKASDELEKELDIEEKKEEGSKEKKGFLGKIKGLFGHKDDHALSEEDKQKLKDQLEGKKPEEPKPEEKPAPDTETPVQEPKAEEKKKEPQPEEKSEEVKQEEPKPAEESEEKKKEKKGFFTKLKEKMARKEDHDEEGFKEEEHIGEPEEKKPEAVKKVASVKVKEKVEKGKTPSIQELMERKGGYEKKLKPSAPKEEKPQEKKEPKEELSVQDIAFGRAKPKEEPKAEEPKPSVQNISTGKTVQEIEKFKKKRPVAGETQQKKEEVQPKEEAEEVKEEEKPPAEEAQEKKEPEITAAIKEEPEKKGFFAKIKEKIATKKISEKQFDEIFWDLEVALLENNIAVEVIEKIKQDLKENLVDKPIPRTKISETILSSLKNSLGGLFDVPELNLFERMEKKKPLVICFLGVNGSGKTTTIAKVAALMQKYKFSCVMAAADTFRAAAIDQLEQHAKALNIKLIKHDYGSDPAAVAFDAVKYAKAKDISAVLIDTAGRLHSNTNLMDEMKKLIRVADPDIKLFIGESITGNDCVEQAKEFNKAVGIDGIILAKADVDEKGGAAISVSYITKKPILYLGVGQRYEDLEEFDSEKLLAGLGI